MPLTPSESELTIDAARQHVEDLRKADPLSSYADRLEEAIRVTEIRLMDMEKVA